jgi:dUTPase
MYRQVAGSSQVQGPKDKPFVIESSMDIANMVFPRFRHAEIRITWLDVTQGFR